MTDWYYHVAGQDRIGPVSDEQLRQALADGRISHSTLAWRTGAAEWQPLRAFAAELGLADAAAVAAAPYAPPRALVEDRSADYVAGSGEVVYAGFWRRAAALCIDSILVGVVYYGLLFAAMFGTGLSAVLAGSGDVDPSSMGAFGGMLVVMYLSYPVISGLYYIGFESSAKQATLGKMAVGIKVTDNEGRRMGRGQALGRWVSHLLCYMTMYIGYIMAGFTDRKRGLHDMVAGTLVVDRWAFTQEPGRQQRGLGTVAIIALVLAGVLVVAYIAILMAIAIPAYNGYLQRAAGAG